MIEFAMGMLVAIATAVGYPVFTAARGLTRANALSTSKYTAQSAILATEERIRQLKKVDESMTPKERIDYAAMRFRELAPNTKLSPEALTVLLEEASYLVVPEEPPSWAESIDLEGNQSAELEVVKGG